jgi:predicted nuclease with TOPRIM domain
MKPSILVVMLDFLVCSLLLFVIGTGGQQTQFATSAPPAVHAEFSAAALQAQQEEWNRDYEQQALLAKLETTTSEKDLLRSRLTETSATLAAREANLAALTAEKARLEDAKQQTDQTLAKVETNLRQVNAEREQLQKEGAAAKERLGKLQTDLAGLQSEQARLQQEKTELAQRAQQLGQTVASQQATITALGEEVRASQARVEAQLSDVAKGQQQMGSTLTQLEALTRTLPEAIQKNAAVVHDDQKAMQENLAALADNVKDLQAGLDTDERQRLMQAVSDVAKGQKDLQSRLDTLIASGQGDQIGQSLSAIEAGQDALRAQTAKLGDQIESIKARGPGPFKAVKGARLELAAALATRDPTERTTARFKATAYPPVIRVDGRSLVVAFYQNLGLNWPGLRAADELTDLQYRVGRTGEVPWSGALDAPVCVLQADPRVVTIALDRPVPGLVTMELAGPEAALQGDQRKLHVFKSTAAGLSFEIDASPDLADPRYLVVKRTLRGPATWFENPAYRPDAGDYVVTADGKLVGMMVTRERCFLLTKDNVLPCALSLPVADKTQFQRAAQQYPRVK